MLSLTFHLLLPAHCGITGEVNEPVGGQGVVSDPRDRGPPVFYCTPFWVLSSVPHIPVLGAHAMAHAEHVDLSTPDHLKVSDKNPL